VSLGDQFRMSFDSWEAGLKEARVVDCGRAGERAGGQRTRNGARRAALTLSPLLSSFDARCSEPRTELGTVIALHGGGRRQYQMCAVAVKSPCPRQRSEQ
jgi:hypothetical protein